MKRFLPILSNFWKIIKVSFGVILFACNSQTEKQIGKASPNLPDEIADSVTVISTDKNNIEYELTAVHIEKFRKKKLTVADSVFIKTFNIDGSVKSTISCNQAEMNETENILVGKGNVIVKSENGVLKTPYLIWNRNTDEIFAKNGVILERTDNIIRGSEMKTDINLNNIKMLKVSAEGKVNEKEIDW
ncbi:MAG: LPS export ABC transporter periplasmic protein LptC [Candidatus Cloacimonas sp. 4484_275]|nr:MAG: LPS export ABC transporter periplasmic protein LptC [Candidatus Cloacimonas sp. 4484_275]